MVHQVQVQYSLQLHQQAVVLQVLDLLRQLELLAVLEAVAEENVAALPVQEILHQFHHLKEIQVVQDNQVLIEALVAAVVQVQLEQMLLHTVTVVMAVLVLILQLIRQQEPQVL
jgi:hypothetical protein